MSRHPFLRLACMAAAISLTACNNDNGDAENTAPQSSSTTTQQPAAGTSSDANGATSNNPAVASGLKMQFADLQGNSGNVTVTGLITDFYGVEITNIPRLKDYGVQLFKTLQTRQDYDAVKRFAHVPLFINNIIYVWPAMNSNAAVLPDVQADYFDNRTIVIIDALSSRLFELKMVELAESAEKIQVAFEMCSNDSMIQEQKFDMSLWFAIPKTTKPIEVLPLRYPPNPGWHPFNPEMGTPKCSNLVSKDGK